jgi:flagellar hook-basal body complex protein FliE
MNSIEPISQIATSASQATGSFNPAALLPKSASETVPVKHLDFGDLMQAGVADMQSKVDYANQMVRSYALNDEVPIHQVTIALEEARVAVELGLQVRSRLVEAYRDIMNMQL